MTINFSFLMIFAMPLLAVGFGLLIYALLSLVSGLIGAVFGDGR
jgi:hypothetical protein